MTVLQNMKAKATLSNSKDMTADAPAKAKFEFNEAEEKEINVDVVLAALDILAHKKEEAVLKNDYEAAGKMHKKMQQLVRNYFG